ncbi:MAG: hypothetical protein K2O66_00140, partial [Bacteroidales bacterium]|nr:hypothetical protein [Bacteroidales bacterium]
VHFTVVRSHYEFDLGADTLVCYNSSIACDMPDQTESYVISGVRVNTDTKAAVKIEAGPFVSDTVIGITGTSRIGCRHTDTIRIRVLPEPYLRFSIVEGDACAMQPFTIGVDSIHAKAGYNTEASYTYSWTVSTASLGAVTGTDSVISIVPGAKDREAEVSLTVTNQLGCTYTKQEIIPIVVWDSIPVLRDTTVCEGSRVSLVDFYGLLGMGYQIQWTGNSAGSDVMPDVYSVISAVDTTNHYHYKITAANNNCVYSDSAVIKVVPKPRLTPIEDVYTCMLTSVRLIYANVGKYSAAQWTVVDTTPDPQGSRMSSYSATTSVFYPSSSLLAKGGVAYTIFTVKGADECAHVEVSDTIQFTFSPKMNITVLGGIQCLGADDVQVKLSILDTNVDHYIWITSTVDTVQNAAGLLYLNPGGDTNRLYHDTLRAWNKEGCEASLNYAVQFVGTPHVVPDTVEICYGDTAFLEVINPSTVLPRWSDLSTGKVVATGNTAKLSPLKTTTYAIQQLRSAANCGGSDRDTVTVKVKDRLLVETTGDTNVCEVTMVNVGVKSVSKTISRYQWIDSASGEVVSTDSAFVVNIEEDKTYYLTVWNDEEGCRDYDTLRLTYGGNVYKLSVYDTTILAGSRLEVYVSGPEPDASDCMYRWYNHTDSVQICRQDSIFPVSVDKDTRYTLYLRGGEHECYPTLNVHVKELYLNDTSVCDYCRTEVGLKADTATDISYVEWRYADTLRFSSTHANPVNLSFTYADTVYNRSESYTDSSRYHVYVVPFQGVRKERDTVVVNPFCDSIFSQPYINLEYEGQYKDLDIYREHLRWNKVDVVCKEAGEGKKFVCDTVFAVRRTQNDMTGEWITMRLDAGQIVNCREVDSICAITSTEHVVDPYGETDTVKVVLDCSGNKPVESQIVCDTIYTLTKGGTTWSPTFIRGAYTVENCQQLAENCSVTGYEVVRALDNTSERVIPKIECNVNVKKTICDTLYTLKKGGTSWNIVYERINPTVINCREVDVTCEITYTTERALDNSSETVMAVVTCVTPPSDTVSVAKKTICDTIYPIVRVGGNILKPVYGRGEGTPTN